MEKKLYYKSKRFWGMVASLLGFILIIIGRYFDFEIGPQVQAVGALLEAFGLPFQFYGGAVADRPLGVRR